MDPTLVVSLLFVFALFNPVLGAVLDYVRREQHLRQFQVQDRIILRLQKEYEREAREGDDCDEKLRLANQLIERLTMIHAAVRGDVNLTNIISSDVGQLASGRDINQDLKK